MFNANSIKKIAGLTAIMAIWIFGPLAIYADRVEDNERRSEMQVRMLVTTTDCGDLGIINLAPSICNSLQGNQEDWELIRSAVYVQRVQASNQQAESIIRDAELVAEAAGRHLTAREYQALEQIAKRRKNSINFDLVHYRETYNKYTRASDQLRLALL